MNASDRVSRSFAVGERQVHVADGMFAEKDIRSLYSFLEALPYRLSDVDSAETAYARHWKAELPIDMATAMPVFRECVAATPQLAAAPRLTLVRVHANLHMHGDLQFPHTDLPGGVTGLYYANPEWEENRQAETIFYDETREAAYAVAPKPGRLVVFDADIVHRAGVPSRLCYTPRISVAFKFIRSDRPPST